MREDTNRNIICEKLATIGLTQWDRVGDLRAARGLAKVTVANGGVASRVEVCFWSAYGHSKLKTDL